MLNLQRELTISAYMVKKDESAKYLDPVFKALGLKVYTYEWIEKLRADNLEKKRHGGKSYNLVPQRGFQESVLTQVADIQIIGGKRGGGKVLPNDADIVTPFGIRKNGDLKIGDILTNPCTGGMERVTDIFEHPNHDFYEIMFDDGSSVECGLEHLWKVRQTGYIHRDRYINGGGYEKDYRVWPFRMIKEWLDKQTNGGHRDRGNKEHLVIPLTEPVKFTKSGYSMRRNDIDPYIIGAILGDGCITDSIHRYHTAQMTLSSGKAEIVAEFEKAGIDMSHCCDDARSDAKQYSIKNEKLEEALTLCKLYGHSAIDKFIPTCYKYATVPERFALIQGMMDTDGYIDAGGSMSYTTISRQLALDFQFVMRSLGASAKLTVDTNAGYKDADGNFVKCNDAYTVYVKIKNPERCFRLTRKKERCAEFNGGKSEVARRIVGYRHIGRKDGRCISVDSTDSLYMTNDFIVTHNTWIGLFEALPYIFHEDVNMYGFRKLEDDVKRGIWKSSKQVYRGLGSYADTTYEWKFLQGKGATMKMEQLQDPKKVSDRFRGVEMAYILIEELAEHTRDNLDVLFDLLASNRSTAGVKPRCVCTCNPVGKSNKLRKFLDWYINPETDCVIPERSGVVRYFYRYGTDVTEIAWGMSPEEVYSHPLAKAKIDELTSETGLYYTDYITSLVFIEGNFSDNEILKVSDPKYMNKISAKGGESTTNDIMGIWRDIDTGNSLVSEEMMERMFREQEHRDGVMRASADVALTGDFFVIFAFDGHHICDMEAWRGMLSDDVPAFIENFLKRNGVRKENFTYDSNGLGLWLKASRAFEHALPFNNKAASSDPRMWNNLKSECAEKFVKALRAHEFSIEDQILDYTFTDDKGNTFNVRDRLMQERRAIKRKDAETGRFEIIQKPQMKIEIGHSPDFIEALMMVMALMDKQTTPIRRGFNLMRG